MTLEGWDRVTWARRRRRAFHVQRRAKPQREGRILVKWLSEGVCVVRAERVSSRR